MNGVKKVAIVGGGPQDFVPNLSRYEEEIDVWIGADRGAYAIFEQNIPLHYAVGDFDSMKEEEKWQVKSYAEVYTKYSTDKDETDLEIALKKALQLEPEIIYLFGVTGGRLDHELVNVQLLYSIMKKGIKGRIIDKQNKLELTLPGSHTVCYDYDYPIISFLPFSEEVTGLTLDGFYYSLMDKNISWGMSLTVSNRLLSKKGTFSYQSGILLLIKSRDVLSW